MAREIKNKTRVAKRSAFHRAIPFLVVFILISVIAWIIPLRPTVSQNERRELTKFPALSWSALSDGSWFSQVGLWFSDTFPGRDGWLKGAATLEEAYGKNDVKIYNTGTGNGGIKADEIPDPVANNGSVTKPSDIPTQNGGTDDSPRGQEPAGTGEEDQNGENTSPLPSQPDPAEPQNPSQENQGTDVQDPTGEHTDDPDPSQGQNQEDLYGPGGTPADEDPNASQDINQFDSLIRLGDAAYEYYYFVSKCVDRYVEAVNSATALGCKIYDILIPNSMGIMLSDEFQAEYGSSDQRKASAYIYSCIDPSVTKVDIFDLLRSHSGEYIYFRTDHHWSALGAYYGYAAFCQAAGLRATPLADFTEYQNPGFLGTLYSAVGKPAAMKENPDTVHVYDPGPGYSMDFWYNKDQVMRNTTLLVDGNELGNGDKYLSFIHGDHPLAIVHNSNLNDGSRILVLKESYGNCFIPFLATNYQEIIVADYRTLDWIDLKGLVAEYQIDTILFLNNMTMTHSSGNTKQLLKFCS